MVDETQTARVAEMVDSIEPLLAGKPPELQGGVLADLVAIYLAGHNSPGDPVVGTGFWSVDEHRATGRAARDLTNSQ